MNQNKQDQAIHSSIESLREAFFSRAPDDLEWRKAQLEQMRLMLTENEGAFCDALRSDLGKSEFESWLTELGFLCNEIDHTLSNMDRWAKALPASLPMALKTAKAETSFRPLGVVLILGAWNYPVQLTLGPLIPALAAGNCAVLKPSELAPATSALMARLVERYLSSQAVRVFEGDAGVATALLEERFDHIFFTGSSRVGRVVMSAAAKHLTPVTLELGGKSPCIVHSTARFKPSIRRIIQGKVTNAGQTCIAPDYALVERSHVDDFVRHFKEELSNLFGTQMKASPQYGRIVSERHFDRLVAMMDEGVIVHGGDHERGQRYIEPTLLIEPKPGSALLEEEIFGPLLPIIPFDRPEDVISHVRGGETPLALYLFAEDEDFIRQIKQHTLSGGMCINDALTQMAVADLPFGGVGASGMGQYHGQWGFETFSHKRALLRNSTLIDPKFRYPPYSKAAQRLLRKIY